MPKKKPESKWNKETVREIILALYNDGHHLTEKNAKKFYPGLPYASKKFHGTWVEALEQSGVPLRDLHRTNWTENLTNEYSYDE